MKRPSHVLVLALACGICAMILLGVPLAARAQIYLSPGETYSVSFFSATPYCIETDTPCGISPSGGYFATSPFFTPVYAAPGSYFESVSLVGPPIPNLAGVVIIPPPVGPVFLPGDTQSCFSGFFGSWCGVATPNGGSELSFIDYSELYFVAQDPTQPLTNVGGTFEIATSPSPEPSQLLLLGIGLLSIPFALKRNRLLGS